MASPRSWGNAVGLTWINRTECSSCQLRRRMRLLSRGNKPAWSGHFGAPARFGVTDLSLTIFDLPLNFLKLFMNLNRENLLPTISSVYDM